MKTACLTLSSESFQRTSKKAFKPNSNAMNGLRGRSPVRLNRHSDKRWPRLDRGHPPHLFGVKLPIVDARQQLISQRHHPRFNEPGIRPPAVVLTLSLSTSKAISTQPASPCFAAKALRSQTKGWSAATCRPGRPFEVSMLSKSRSSKDQWCAATLCRAGR